MGQEALDATGRRRVSPWPFILTGLIFAVILFGGYGLICWRDAHQRWSQGCFDRPVRELAGHTGWVYGVAISPDGRFALSGGEDRTLRLWSLADGRELRQFTGHASDVNRVAFAPDGKRALSSSDDSTVRLWELGSGRELKVLRGHQQRVWPVAFRRDGRQAVSAGEDGTIRLWDLERGVELRQFGPAVPPTTSAGPAVAARRTGVAVSALVLLPDDQRVLTGGQAQPTSLWDLATGRAVKDFAFPELAQGVESLAVSPDGQRALAGSDYYKIQLLDLEHGKELKQLSARTEQTWAIAFAPDGRHALSGGSGGTLRLWELESGKLVRAFQFPPGEGERTTYAAAFSPDGCWLITGGGRQRPDGQVQAELFLWRLPDRLGLWTVGTVEEPPAQDPSGRIMIFTDQ